MGRKRQAKALSVIVPLLGRADEMVERGVNVRLWQFSVMPE
jgi:hypothetical protein